MVENRQFEELHEQRTWQHGDARKAWAHIIQQGMLDHQKRCSLRTEEVYGSDDCWASPGEIKAVGHALLDRIRKQEPWTRARWKVYRERTRRAEKPDLSPWNQTCKLQGDCRPTGSPAGLTARRAKGKRGEQIAERRRKLTNGPDAEHTEKSMPQSKNKRKNKSAQTRKVNQTKVESQEKINSTKFSQPLSVLENPRSSFGEQSPNPGKSQPWHPNLWILFRMGERTKIQGRDILERRGLRQPPRRSLRDD